MGTPATIKVYDEEDRCILAMYCHSDGYFHGVGLDLAKFLSGITMVNGIPDDADDEDVANGMEDLAGLIVCHFKQMWPGDFYLYPTDCDPEDFHYIVKMSYGDLIMIASSAEWGDVYNGKPINYVRGAKDLLHLSTDEND